MSAERITAWAADRGLDSLPEPSRSGVLIPFGGETGVWTTRVTIERGWVLVQALTDLEVAAERIAAALHFVGLVSQVERVGILRLDPSSGAVGTGVATLAPTLASVDLAATLDPAWEASVRVTETWVPGLRDVASGVDPEAAFRRVTGLLGELR